jgi:hypothetical protein
MQLLTLIGAIVLPFQLMKNSSILPHSCNQLQFTLFRESKQYHQQKSIKLPMKHAVHALKSFSSQPLTKKKQDMLNSLVIFVSMFINNISTLDLATAQANLVLIKLKTARPTLLEMENY